jgi:hypothetical protein
VANEIKITLAGDPTSASRAFDQVGSSADRMSKNTKEAASSFDRAGEAADTVDTRSMGLRDTLTGVQDSLGGVAKLSKGPSVEGFLLLGTGIGDLGSGFYNALIPGLKSSITWLRAGGIASAAHAVQSGIATAATKTWAAAQWVLDAAMTANPIAIIVIAIIALIAIVVLIATKTTWFQTAWEWSWTRIKDAAAAVGGWFTGTLWPWIKGVFDKIVNLPGKVTSAFASIAWTLGAPFRSAFNVIARAWDSTVGRLHWSVPSWVPGIGGNSISAPKLPTFHAGGTVPGAPGAEMLALLQAGETITPAGGDRQRVVVELRASGDRLVQALLDLLADAVSRRGGGLEVMGFTQ